MPRLKAANVFSVFAVVIAALITLWQATAQYGAFGVAFGDFSFLFWMLVAVWLVSVALALRWTRRWWILLTMPVILLPVGIWLIFTVQCLRGNCL